MTSLHVAILLFALAASPQRALNNTDKVEGNWKAWFVNLNDPQRPHMINNISFDFQVDGKQLKGTAHLDIWPGDAPITDGTIEDDRVSFTVIGTRASSTGLPKFKFNGSMRDGKMKLVMGYTLKEDQRISGELAVEGEKASR